MIIELLQESGSVLVAELSRRFEVSEETIRRDLTKMESNGLLCKTYGGAFINAGKHREVPVSMRNTVYLEAKDAIAAFAAESVQNGDTIFLDGSSTAIHIAEHLCEKKNLIVITNALKVAEALARSRDVKVICVGGTLRATSLTVVGRTAEAEIEKYFADKAFICCDGLHQSRGVTDANEREAEVRRQMMCQAESSILVADASKFDVTSFVHIAEFDDFDLLITDKEPSDEWKKTLADHDLAFKFQDAGTGK
ncbi:DeoR/GlpR family DNA-binding transcription regulator [Alkalispirochaeta alkalica]|uniref:DeoR/GlpR family DNA-binding transcription regulator n=1 Tax=Alkalispirochaeta alkalica TaxID=46356 RepID=UPI00068715EC|nr:DeoR/GlpR family DNA-binding transcription regulator [Alkalispirochaeta alkalica]